MAMTFCYENQSFPAESECGVSSDCICEFVFLRHARATNLSASNEGWQRLQQWAYPYIIGSSKAFCLAKFARGTNLGALCSYLKKKSELGEVHGLGSENHPAESWSRS